MAFWRFDAGFVASSAYNTPMAFARSTSFIALALTAGVTGVFAGVTTTGAGVAAASAAFAAWRALRAAFLFITGVLLAGSFMCHLMWQRTHCLPRIA